MAKKTFIIAAIFIVIIIVISIIIALVNIKPAEFQVVVSYDNNTTVMRPASNYAASVASSDGDVSFLTNLLKYEKTIMFSSIFFVLIFAALFHGLKRGKS